MKKEENRTENYFGLRCLKYLLLGSVQKKLANPCSCLTTSVQNDLGNDCLMCARVLPLMENASSFWSACILFEQVRLPLLNSAQILPPDCCSVAQSYPTLQPHGLQDARLPCPSLSSRVCSDSCPLSQWCHSIISSSIVPLPFLPWSFPTSGSFHSFTIILFYISLL